MKRKLSEDDDATAPKRAASSNEKGRTTTQTTAGSMSLSEFLQASTLPRLGPFKADDPSCRNKFYVRDCYPRYYDHIMKLFTDTESPVHGITITGTPGIGKKLFMAYFFQRYRLENAQSNIHVETRKTNFALKTLCVWEGEKSTLTFCKNRHVDVDNLTTLRSRDDSIRLIVGCPEDIPQCNRWICFTNSSTDWKNETQPVRSHRQLVMPMWDPAELRDAAQALGLDALLEEASVNDIDDCSSDFAALNAQLAMDQDVIGLRFSVFGGVARACLETKSERLRGEYERVMMACELVHNSTQAVQAFDVRVVNMIVQCIAHYSPHNSDASMAPSIDAGSPLIKQELRKRFLEVDEDGRCRVDDSAQDSLFDEWLEPMLHEVRAHHILQNGTTIKAKAFVLDAQQHNQASRSFQIDPTPSLLQLTTRFKRTNLAHGPYYIPKIKTRASFDGLYLTPENGSGGQQPRAILFQISATHKPLLCDGVLQVLKNMDLWDEVQRSPSDSVAIVHVVPANDKSKWQREPFEMCEELTDDSSLHQVQGLGRISETLQKEFKIETVGQLDACCSDSTAVAMAKRLVEAQKARVATSGSHVAEILEKIPQFLWSI